MKKHLLFSFLALVLFLQTGISQTYIWGGPGDKNSEFNGGLNDWTTVSIYPNDKALWEWRANGKPDKGSFTKLYPAIESSSVTNGAAIFDSDFLDSKGSGTTGTGVSVAPQVSELISPTFSCAGKQSVFLRFNSYIRNFSTKVFYSTSIDGGQSWDTPTQIHSRINLYEFTLPANIELIDISQKVGGYGNVKIKFIWGTQEDGDYYFWLIDDVYIMEDPGADVVIDGTWYPSIWYSLPRDFVNHDSMYFLMYVINRGSKDIENVKGKVTLKNLDKKIVYFSDSLNFNLAKGDTARIDLKSFMPSITMDTGLYAAIYEITSQNFAIKSSGKFFQQIFKLSPNLKIEDNVFSNKFSSADTRHGNSVSWMDGSRDCAVLNYYKTPDWVINDNFKVFAESGTFKNGGSQTDITTNMYLWEVSDTVNNQFYNFDFLQGIEIDGKASTQLEYIGYGSEHFPTYQNWTSETVPLYNLNDEETIQLTPNKKYLLGIYWEKDKTIFSVWDNWGTYGYNSSFQRYYDGGKDFANTLDQRVSFLYINDGSNARFYTIGEYGAFVMDLKLKVQGIVATEDELLPENAISIVENPIINDLEINIDLENSIEKASIAIYDLNGSLIHLRTINDLHKSTQKFYLGNAPAGEYIITLFTKDKLISKKFVVVK